MSAAIPPDALHSARATATTSVIETPARLALMIEVSWNTRKFWTSLGTADATSLACCVTFAGLATSP